MDLPQVSSIPENQFHQVLTKLMVNADSQVVNMSSSTNHGNILSLQQNVNLLLITKSRADKEVAVTSNELARTLKNLQVEVEKSSIACS